MTGTLRSHPMPGLGRLPAPDPRDAAFPMTALLPQVASTRIYRYWTASGWWGDQGSTPQCVGYGWAHWIEDGPIGHAGAAPILPPAVIYREAQAVDEWPGPPPAYDGTSVRAGAKVVAARGFISAYHWATDVPTLVEALLEVGPVVVGTNWYESMFHPDPTTALLHISGAVAGGHCYVLDGVNKHTRRFRMKNSWGRDWGNRGFAKITFDDFARLLSEGGEACLATEVAL